MAPRITTSALVAGLLGASCRCGGGIDPRPASCARAEPWLIALITAVVTLTAGPDPMPITGAWS